MLDIKLFRAEPETILKDHEKRGRNPEQVHKVIDRDRQWRETRQKADELRAQRNSASKEIQQLKKTGNDKDGTKIGQLIKEMGNIK